MRSCPTKDPLAGKNIGTMRRENYMCIFACARYTNTTIRGKGCSMTNIEGGSIGVESSSLCRDVHVFEKGGKVIREWHG
jgi:hypothetical protein